mgnify:CR=1 FL=1
MNRYSQLELDKLFCALNAERQIKRCKVYSATNDLMIEYFGSKEDVIKLLCLTNPDMAVIPEHALTSVTAARDLQQEYTGKLLQKIAAEGTAVLMVTHELDTTTYGNRTYVMDRGRLTPSKVTL